ncbi:MAG: hypothetical protein ACI8RZ_005571 [Myxococcota bacterium]|jgi:hypothetical protein
MISLWLRWVRFWSTVEAPQTMAVVRIVVGLIIAVDFALMLSAGIIDPLYVPIAEGGFAPGSGGPWLALLGGPSTATAYGLTITAMVSAGLLCVGLGGRLTAFVLLQVLITFHGLPIDIGGGYDRLILNMVFLLMLSRSTATLSIDCRLRTGSWHSTAPIMAFPRYLMVAQLVVMYVMTGLHKTGPSWESPYPAVYRALLRPTYARWEASWMGDLYPLTQLGTWAAWWWEVSFVVLGLWFVARRGVLGTGAHALAKRIDLRIPYLGIGLLMHMTLWVMMNIGPFSAITLSYYLAFIEPEEWTKRRNTPEPAPP